MARIPRKLQVLPNHAVHKIWRGHNKERNLGSDGDKLAYLQYLNEELESKKFDTGADLSALTLMDNHGHEVFGVQSPEKFSGHMRRHHSRYGAYFNRKHERSGKVAEDRPKTCLIGDDYHEMITVFYVHANPVRANMVGDARDYYWSTHRLYAFGKREPWMKNVRLPRWYLALGPTAALRQRQYRRLFYRYLRDHGKTRQRFLRRPFFGPIMWQVDLEKKVSEWRSAAARPG
jgi:putative transposase